MGRNYRGWCSAPSAFTNKIHLDFFFFLSSNCMGNILGMKEFRPLFLCWILQCHFFHQIIARYTFQLTFTISQMIDRRRRIFWEIIKTFLFVMPCWNDVLIQQNFEEHFLPKIIRIGKMCGAFLVMHRNTELSRNQHRRRKHYIRFSSYLCSKYVECGPKSLAHTSQNMQMWKVSLSARCFSQRNRENGYSFVLAFRIFQTVLK